MCWGKFVVQSVTGMDFVGKPVPKRTSAASCPATAAKRIVRKTEKKKTDEEHDFAGTEEEATETYVSIPVLINKVPLKSGDEVVAYRQKSAKRTRGPEAITISRVARLAVKGSSTNVAGGSSSSTGASTRR